MSRPRVTIYTDGACSPNPGIGGWAAILISPQHGNFVRELSGSEKHTTNNRMELTAAVRALEALKRPCEVELFTDSEYLQKAFSEGWLNKWQQKGWRTRNRKPVANQDLWMKLSELTETHIVAWKWLKGHASHPLNERCDTLAVAARESFREGLV